MAALAQMESGHELGRLTLQLERAIAASALPATWRADRPAWAMVLGMDIVPPQVAGQLMALAEAMPDGSMRATWPAERSAWLRRTTGSPGAAQVARLLLDFEEALRRESMKASWSRARTRWIARLGEIAGGIPAR